MALPTDHQLVAALLEATEGLSLRERQRATGIHHATLQRFRLGKWEQLQARTRQAAVRYLERVKKMPEAVPAEPLSNAERVRLLELVEEMGRVLRGEGR